MLPKFPEGHPAHRAVTGTLSHSQPPWAAGKPLEKPSLVSAAPDHTWPLQPGEHIECSNCCDTGLNQGSTDSTGPRSWWLHLAPCESNWGQGKNWQDTGSSCQLCPEGFTTAINAQWLKVTHRSLRAASLQGNPGKLWAGNPGSFAVPQDLQ